MPVWVQIDEPWQATLDAAALRRAAETALRVANDPATAEPILLTIRVTDTATVQRLNRRYRGYDKPTDVLAFPADEVDLETGARYLGDVVIAYPVAAAQARQGGHRVEDELVLLTVHGVLHLLGYDDEEPAARRRMWAMQARVLEAVGCPLRPPL
ncbi:MAG: rRNA maturation RNase YbeY [Chloroflexi bacterium]|nr:rRNA maturation RNase YbeY [Chloroflexota bacterium]